LEQLKSEVDQRILAQRFRVLENVEVPLVELVHHFDQDGPVAHTNRNHLLDAFLVFFTRVRVDFVILSVQFFQEIIKVAFEPLSGVVRRLGGELKPRFRLHVQVLLLVGHVEIQIVELVRLDNVYGEVGLLLDLVVQFG